MNYIDKKSIVSKILFNSKTFALLGLIIIFLIGIPLVKKVSQQYKIDQEIKDLKDEIIALDNKNINLKEFISYLESDQFIEEQARLQFGLKKDGEEVVAIKVDGPNAGLKQQNFNFNILDNKYKTKIINNPQRWVKYFFE